MTKSPCAVPTSTAVRYCCHGKFRAMAMLPPRLTPRHGSQELLQTCRVGIEGHERVGAAILGFVLWSARTQRGREMAPEGIEPVVGHLENAANVGWLALVQEERGGRRVAVIAVTALEKFKRHQRIEKIPRPAAMQPKPPLQHFQRLGAVG